MRTGAARVTQTDEQVIAANIDIAFIVAGLDDDFNLRRLERYLAVAWASGVTPVIILNKADIADDLEARLARGRNDRSRAWPCWSCRP